MPIIVGNRDLGDVGRGAGAYKSKKIFFSPLERGATDNYTILNQSFQCRDLLLNWLYHRQYARRTIYINNKETLLFIKANQLDTNRILRNIKHLHSFEREAGIKLTELIKYDNNGIIVKGDSLWGSTYWKVSLYTFLLKKLSYIGGVPWKKAREEIRYEEVIQKNRNLLTVNLKNKKEITPYTEPNIYAKYHFFWSTSNCGFYSILSNINHPQRDVLIKYQKQQKTKTKE